MTEVKGGGGLRPALLPARLVQLLGPERLSCVHAIMDSLRGSPNATSPGAVQRAIAKHLPSLDGAPDSMDLVDHQKQDLPLAIFLLTHPALPRGAAPFLLLRTLAAWQPSDLSRLYGVTPDRVQSKLNAGIRRIRSLGLGVTWPHFLELTWRVKHSIEVIEQLDAAGRNRGGWRLGKTDVCEYARYFLEALANSPITRSPWVMERWWRICYAESAPVEPATHHPFLLHGDTTPFMTQLLQTAGANQRERIQAIVDRMRWRKGATPEANAEGRLHQS